MRATGSRRAGLRSRAAVVAALLVGSPAAAADLERETDEAIRSACHGFVATEAADGLASALGAERSPRCDPEASPPVPAEQPSPDEPEDEAPVQGASWELGPRLEPNLQIEIDCAMEYKCVEERVKLRDRGHPVSQEGYDRVARHCRQSYACIESWFDEWPRPLPEPREAAGRAGSQPPANAAPAPARREAKPAPPAAAKPEPPAPAAAPNPPRQRPARSKGSSASRARIEDNRAFAVDYTQSGRSGAQLRVSFGYANRSAVPLRIGPVMVRVVCSDGTAETHGLGPALDVPAGETRSGSWTPDAETAGRVCRQREITEYRARPQPGAHQPGIHGPLEQAVVCPDGRRVTAVVRMADDGRRFEFVSSLGGRVEVTAAKYDARRIASRFCGGPASSYGARREWVAEGRAYLSHDFHRYVSLWSESCARDLESCRTVYRDVNGD